MRLVSETDYLEHHGIKGQKWGIRRYQNPDGSLTETGKKHYLKKIDRAEKRQRMGNIQYNPNSKKREIYQDRHKNVLGVRDEMHDALVNLPSNKRLHKLYGQLDDYNINNPSNGDDYYKDDPEWNRIMKAIDKNEARYRKESGEVYLSFKNKLLEAKLKDLHLKTDSDLMRLYEEYYLSKRPFDTNLYWLD